jgi:Cu+-exporting ATPase
MLVGYTVKMEEGCYHCGDKIVGKSITFDNKDFCCTGCKLVYTLLKDNQLDRFYKYEAVPGTKPDNLSEGKYDFLELLDIRDKIILFEEGSYTKVLLYLPSIHCSSCIYLLENISKLEPAISQCVVNFTAREASITFDSSKLKLSELATLLHRIGYTPNFGNRKKTQKLIDKQFLTKLGIAGFAFGSIMLWSFPEYLGIEEVNPEFRYFMSYLSFAISIPVLVYSGNEFIISAWKAVRAKSINLDVPITIGIFALYFQSSYAIFSGQGAGYMDSFAGFIFFLLIGKWFQSKTYQSLSFERDYTSYFPIAVTKVTENIHETIAIEKLQKGDIILIRNEEIIPCDAVLTSDEATMDYSFVTGESELLTKKRGELVFAGGKIIGKSVQLEVKEVTNRSHLTSLWNSSSTKESTKLFSDVFSKWFLIVVLIVSAIASVVWWFIDFSKTIEVVVAILIVACPCALALSAPFTYGNSMRLLGRKSLYLKHVTVVKDLEHITDIVFDKTGTLTEVSSSVNYEGYELSSETKDVLFSMAHSSTHPYAVALKKELEQFIDSNSTVNLASFEEIKGKGMTASYAEKSYQLGSAKFVGIESEDDQSSIYVRIDDKIQGRYTFRSQLREGLKPMIQQLSKYKLHVLSGDSEKDKEMLEELFSDNATIQFRQTPQSKRDYILQLKKQGANVLMIGDGLNDSGALKEANVGISITEDVFQFTPSSDAILDAKKLKELPILLKISAFSKTILRVCFGFSLLYNTIGLSFAISGKMEPIVAAIIMPLSSITIVAVATFGIVWFAPKK